MSNVTAEQKKEVKGRGFLPSRDGEHFAARIITVNGVINASQAKKKLQKLLKNSETVS